MPTAAELNALPYTGRPAQGMTGNDFKDNLWKQTGDTVRWWKGFQVDDGNVLGPNGEKPTTGGYIYVEQSLAADVRVHIYNDDSDVTTERTDSEYIELSHGRTSVSYLPWEIGLALGGRLLFTSRTVLGSYVATPNGAPAVKLPYGYVDSIVSVLGSGGTIDPADYSVTDDATKSGLTWTGSAPGGVVCIEYLYNPLFIFLKHWNRIMDHSNLQGPSGVDGKRLPQRVTMIQDRV